MAQILAGGSDPNPGGNTQVIQQVQTANWEQMQGKPYITVSAKGIVNGLSSIPNDGADFGPDTKLNATAPGQYGSSGNYTETYGCQEIYNYALKKATDSSGLDTPTVKMLNGVFYWDVTVEIDGSTYTQGISIEGSKKNRSYVFITSAIDGLSITGNQLSQMNISDISFQYKNATGALSSSGHAIHVSPLTSSEFSIIYSEFRNLDFYNTDESHYCLYLENTLNFNMDTITSYGGLGLLLDNISSSQSIGNGKWSNMLFRYANSSANTSDAFRFQSTGGGLITLMQVDNLEVLNQSSAMSDATHMFAIISTTDSVFTQIDVENDESSVSTIGFYFLSCSRITANTIRYYNKGGYGSTIQSTSGVFNNISFPYASANLTLVSNTSGLVLINPFQVNIVLSSGDYPKIIYNGLTVSKSSITAGTSPYTFPTLQYDAVYILTTANGISALTLDGETLSTTVGIPILVTAGHTLIATWATTAPVFEVIPQ